MATPCQFQTGEVQKLLLTKTEWLWCFSKKNSVVSYMRSDFLPTPKNVDLQILMNSNYHHLKTQESTAEETEILEGKLRDLGYVE